LATYTKFPTIYWSGDARPYLSCMCSTAMASSSDSVC